MWKEIKIKGKEREGCEGDGKVLRMKQGTWDLRKMGQWKVSFTLLWQLIFKFTTTCPVTHTVMICAALKSTVKSLFSFGLQNTP